MRESASLILREILTDADDVQWFAIGLAVGILITAGLVALIWWRLRPR